MESETKELPPYKPLWSTPGMDDLGEVVESILREPWCGCWGGCDCGGGQMTLALALYITTRRVMNGHG